MSAAALKPEVADASKPDRRLLNRTILVTPTMAQEWLAKSATNRPLNQRHIETLADAIRRDQWRFSGESIKFNTAGELIDGQHRLNAVIMANKSVYFLVVENVEEDAMAVIDTGRKRTSSDVLGINGYSNTVVVAAAIRTIFGWKRSVEAGGLILSHAQSTEFANKNKQIFRLAEDISSTAKYPRGKLLAVYWLATEAGAYEAEFRDFLNGLGSGAGLPPGSPILALREWYARVKGQRGKVHGNMYLYALIRAWNAYAEGRQLHKIDSQTRPPQITGENLNAIRKFK